MDKIDNKKSPNLINNFFCEKCNYKTCNKKDFNKHLLTQKHKNKDNDNNYQKSHFYVCEKCNKSYFNNLFLGQEN